MVAKAKWQVTSAPLMSNIHASYTIRDAWKSYEGFPQKSAAMAYVFLANQLEAEDPTKKTGEEILRGAGENAMAVTVSTFAHPLQ